MPFLPAEPGTEDKLLPHPPFLTVGSFDWARHTFKPLCACMLSHARLFHECAGRPQLHDCLGAPAWPPQPAAGGGDP